MGRLEIRVSGGRDGGGRGGVRREASVGEGEMDGVGMGYNMLVQLRVDMDLLSMCL